MTYFLTVRFVNITVLVTVVIGGNLLVLIFSWDKLMPSHGRDIESVFDLLHLLYLVKVKVVLFPFELIVTIAIHVEVHSILC